MMPLSLALDPASNRQELHTHHVICDVRARAHTVPLEDEAAKLTMAKLHEFCHKVEKELHLDGVWDLKPLINGQDLMKLLGLPPGPAIRILLEWFTLSPTYTRTQQVITTAHSHTTHYTTHYTTHASYNPGRWRGS
jgi:hypothetical protein